MKISKKKKIVLILVMLGMVSVIGFVVFLLRPDDRNLISRNKLESQVIKSETVLYKLPTVDIPNIEFLKEKTFLKELQIIEFGGPKAEVKVARSDIELHSPMFAVLVDGLIENGFILYNVWFSGIKINKRDINEDDENIIITDSGEWSDIKERSNINDTTVQSGTGQILLRFRYEKQTKAIYFEVLRGSQ